MMRGFDTPLRRLAIAVVVSVLDSLGVNAGVLEESRLANVVLSVGVPMFFVWWIRDDARRTGYWPFYHYGLWLYLAPFALVPHYVLHTRGRRGALVALGMFVLSVLPILAAWLGAWLFPHVPEPFWVPE